MLVCEHSISTTNFTSLWIWPNQQRLVEVLLLLRNTLNKHYKWEQCPATVTNYSEEVTNNLLWKFDRLKFAPQFTHCHYFIFHMCMYAHLHAFLGKLQGIDGWWQQREINVALCSDLENKFEFLGFVLEYF